MGQTRRNRSTGWLDLLDEFLQHWADADAELAPAAIVLLGGYGRASLVADRASLELDLDAVVNLQNASSVAAANRDLKQHAIGRRMLQFNHAVRGLLPGTTYLASLTRVPQVRQKAEIWDEAMNDVRNLWIAINLNNPPVPGFVPPLVLPGGYSVLLFQGEQAQVLAATTAARQAGLPLDLARTQRDARFLSIYERLKQYRQAVRAKFSGDDPLVQSLPKIWNSRKGRTKSKREIDVA